MNSAISINKHIYTILSTDTKLRKLVGKSIFPIIAEEGTTFPFIIFKRNSVEVEYTKDGQCRDKVSVSIAIATKNYNENVEIAERVRELLELKKNDYFNRILLTSVTEDFIDDSYIQELNFQAFLR